MPNWLHHWHSLGIRSKTELVRWAFNLWSSAALLKWFVLSTFMVVFFTNLKFQALSFFIFTMYAFSCPMGQERQHERNPNYIRSGCYSPKPKIGSKARQFPQWPMTCSPECLDSKAQSIPCGALEQPTLLISSCKVLATTPLRLLRSWLHTRKGRAAGGRGAKRVCLVTVPKEAPAETKDLEQKSHLAQGTTASWFQAKV